MKDFRVQTRKEALKGLVLNLDSDQLDVSAVLLFSASLFQSKRWPENPNMVAYDMRNYVA